MFPQLICLLLSSLLPERIQLRVDHVTVAGRNLATMRREFDAVGIHTVYGGRHTNGLTEMALASFGDGSYLELIAAQSPAAGAQGHNWGQFIDGDAGPCAWAIPVTDVTARATQFGGTVNRSGRKRPDGVDLQWMTASIGPGPQGTFFPFLIQDITPRERRAFPQGTPSSPDIRGVEEVFIGVRNLDSAITQYRQAFGLDEPELSFDEDLQANLARFRGTPVVLGTAGGGWLAERLARFGDGPFAFVFRRGPGKSLRWLPVSRMRIGVIG